MTRLRLASTVFILFIATVLFAQDKFGDKLIQRDGKVIVCQVREIGDDEIKYVQEGYRSDLVFGIDKNKVEKIVFSDGREMKLSDSMYGKENYTLQRKNALKFHFFSPIYNATAFTYERSLKPGSSIEVGVGIIGLGKDLNNDDASGVYFNVGYKFIKDPDFYLKGMRYAHVLKGAYFKPEIAFSTYHYFNDYNTYQGYNTYGRNRERVMMGAFILNVGKQWVFTNRFLVDWYVGAGYGFGKNDADYRSTHFAFTGATDDMPLVFNSGFSIGFLY
ncbi:MAG TPA: hypothetical protein DCL77_00770 [Prolixibacteraceae bacterium]|jgi:hypothetical protein|nr:hypothetical protein [Prolixibacteraceae bacterium]